ncbi:HlyD family secretion protein [Sphingobacterium haloxyli]|uniref:Hemolysin D n=1 Tax=Sphingobacterium haloxyli TaxID=2100533 RepID=A0A2S9J4L9_9SPHI|nr:HlyD family secretion protein [Sphingobacterium haloxyli]PRD47738.1 hemolysin D [Sphingobacterium haloxyli]
MSEHTENNKVKQEEPVSGNEQRNAKDAGKESRKVKPKTNMRLRVTIVNLLVFIVVAGGFIWLVQKYFHIGDDDFTNAAQVEAFINPVNTRVSAYIKEIRFIEHQQVKKGDTLLILDDREILTQLGQAEAAYENALASKGVTTSTVSTVANNVHVTDANIAGARARLQNAEKNLERYRNLLKSEAVTKFQYDQIETEYDVAKSSYEVLLNQRKSAGLSVSEAQSRLHLNDAEIKRTKAAHDMARLNLSYTVITAPYDGIMGRRTINEGQLLQPGQQVATIVLDNNKWVTANFLESQMPGIHIGQRIRMTADAIGKQEFDGVVTAVSAATGSRYSMVPVDNSSGNFVKVQQRIPVRIEFTENNDPENLQELRAGMNMNVFIKN